MPSTPPTRRQKLEAREAAIVAAARAVFLEQGHRGTTVTEIARRADVAEGTLYLYFKNKQAIMEAVATDHWANLTVGAAAAVRPHDETLGQLAALAHFHINALIEQWPLIELSLARRMAEPDGALNDEVDFRRAYVATFDQVFRRGQDRAEIRADAALWLARDFFYGTLEYAARSAMLAGQRNSDDAVQFVMDLFSSSMLVAAGPGANEATKDLASLTRRLESVTADLRRLERRPG